MISGDTYFFVGGNVMTLKEAEKKFGISHSTLEQYVYFGFIRKAGTSSEESFQDEDFENLGMIDTLLNAGFTPKETKDYLLLSKENKTEQQQITILTNKRRIILDEIHKKQKLLDCLDYMLWEKKKGDGGKRNV